MIVLGTPEVFEVDREEKISHPTKLLRVSARVCLIAGTKSFVATQKCKKIRRVFFAHVFVRN